MTADRAALRSLLADLGRSSGLAWTIPSSFGGQALGVAEQIRLMAYAAVGSGYRGLGFWSDRFLADSHAGRDRLLALALLNQELEMLEPILVDGREPTWIDTSRPEVKAAVIRTKDAVLVLPMWIWARLSSWRRTRWLSGRCSTPGTNN